MKDVGLVDGGVVGPDIPRFDVGHTCNGERNRIVYIVVCVVVVQAIEWSTVRTIAIGVF